MILETWCFILFSNQYGDLVNLIKINHGATTRENNATTRTMMRGSLHVKGAFYVLGRSSLGEGSLTQLLKP